MFLSLYTMTHISGITFSFSLSDESETFTYIILPGTMEEKILYMKILF